VFGPCDVSEQGLVPRRWGSSEVPSGKRGLQLLNPVCQQLASVPQLKSMLDSTDPTAPQEIVNNATDMLGSFRNDSRAKFLLFSETFPSTRTKEMDASRKALSITSKVDVQKENTTLPIIRFEKKSFEIFELTSSYQGTSQYPLPTPSSWSELARHLAPN
jgi:hypothetical protein